MKIKLFQIGKTTDDFIEQGLIHYAKRLKNYAHFEIHTIPYLKNKGAMPQELQKNAEGIKLLDQIDPKDFLILLDDKGKQLNSNEFAQQIEKITLAGNSTLSFAVGGAYGFSEAVYQRANLQISLSKMTFSHQLVRLVFVEQMYRAFTILNHEPYHHQ